MFGPLGFPEILFILTLALLIFGPRKLPEIGRTLGKGLAELRKATNEVKRTVNLEMLEEELRESDPRKDFEEIRQEFRDSDPRKILDPTRAKKTSKAASEGAGNAEQSEDPGGTARVDAAEAEASQPEVPEVAAPTDATVARGHLESEAPEEEASTARGEAGHAVSHEREPS